MAEERSGGRNRRRRYFKPKKQKDGSAPEAAGAASGKATPPAADTRSGNVRNRNKTRRRARSRQRPAEENRSQAVLEKETPYVPPKEIYVYTHSANPDLRDTYEFRPEHFSSVGRRLEDYQIDIAKLFVPDAVAGDGTPVLAKLPPPTYNWTEWEED